MSEQNEKLTAEDTPAYKIYDLAVEYATNQISVSEFTEGSNAIIFQQVEHATAELRKELGEVEKSRNTFQQRFIQKKDEYYAAMGNVRNLSHQLAEAQRQRDEVVELLKEWQEYGDAGAVEWTCGDTIYEDTVDLISRLSSGETKSGSEWIKSSDKLPTQGQCIDIYTEGSYMYSACRVDTDNVANFMEWTGTTHWRPQTALPAPPESLTDKHD